MDGDGLTDILVELFFVTASYRCLYLTHKDLHVY